MDSLSTCTGWRAESKAGWPEAGKANMNDDEKENKRNKYLELFNAAVRDSLRHLPTPDCEITTEGEQTVLVYKHQLGDFELRYKPSDALDERALEIGKALTKVVCETDFGGRPLYDLPSGEQWPGIMAVWFKMFFAHCLGNNAVIAVRSTMREAELITAAFCNSQ
jgi:hypothetical protein